MNKGRTYTYTNLLPTRTNWFGWCVLALTIAISILWLGNTPLHTDDFYYQHVPGPDDSTSMWLHKGDKITSFTQIPTAVINHRHNVNGRMSNAAYLAVQPLPVWMIKYFCGIVLAFFAWLLWRWCGRRSLQNNLIAFAVPLLLWTGLQWGDQMQSSDFQFNYTIPSVMLVGCMIFFYSRKKTPDIWGWILLIVFSTWHECFTILFGVFLGVQWLFKRDKQTFFAICILIAGALFQFSAGTQDRLGVNLSNATTLSRYFPWTLFIAKTWICPVAIILWLLRRRHVKRNVRKTLDRFGIGLIATWVVGLALLIGLAAPQRAHWACEVLGILFILSILKTYRFINPVRWLKIGFLLVYALWGGNLIYWQLRVTKFTNFTIKEIQNGKVAVDDTDGISEVNIPFWLREMTRLQYTPFESWEHYSLPCVVSNGRTAGYIIRPKSLIGTSFDQWPKYAGNTDMRRGGGKLITRKHDGRDFTEEQIIVTFGKPTISASPFDRLLTFIKTGSEDSIATKMRVCVQNFIIVEGDTIDVLNLERQPRTTKGRPIIAINFPD